MFLNGSGWSCPWESLGRGRGGVYPQTIWWYGDGSSTATAINKTYLPWNLGSRTHGYIAQSDGMHTCTLWGFGREWKFTVAPWPSPVQSSCFAHAAQVLLTKSGCLADFEKAPKNIQTTGTWWNGLPTFHHTPQMPPSSLSSPSHVPHPPQQLKNKQGRESST